MVFHNKALFKIIGDMSQKELDHLLQMPLFVNNDKSICMSLMTAAQSRYSDMVIGQAFKLDRQEPKNNAESKTTENVGAKDQTNLSARSTVSDKILSFQRNEVIFDNRECIVLNIRDLTDQESSFASRAKIKQLNDVIEMQASEIKDSLIEIKRKSGQII